MSRVGCGMRGVVITGNMDLLGQIWHICRGATQWPDDNNEFF